MTKKELARRVRGPFTVQMAEWLITDIEKAIIQAVSSGEEVNLRGFGVFCSTHHKEKACNLPTTGIRRIPAGRRVRFIPGKLFKKSMNP